MITVSRAPVPSRTSASARPRSDAPMASRSRTSRAAVAWLTPTTITDICRPAGASSPLAGLAGHAAVLDAHQEVVADQPSRRAVPRRAVVALEQSPAQVPQRADRIAVAGVVPRDDGVEHLRR